MGGFRNDDAKSESRRGHGEFRQWDICCRSEIDRLPLPAIAFYKFVDFRHRLQTYFPQARPWKRSRSLSTHSWDLIATTNTSR